MKSRGLPNPVDAATYTVTNGNNSGAGSFRQAVADASASPGPDVISIAPQLLVQVSTGVVSYTGAGANNSLATDGNNAVTDGTVGMPI